MLVTFHMNNQFWYSLELMGYDMIMLIKPGPKLIHNIISPTQCH